MIAAQKLMNERTLGSIGTGALIPTRLGSRDCEAGLALGDSIVLDNERVSLPDGGANTGGSSKSSGWGGKRGVPALLAEDGVPLEN